MSNMNFYLIPQAKKFVLRNCKNVALFAIERCYKFMLLMNLIMLMVIVWCLSTVATLACNGNAKYGMCIGGLLTCLVYTEWGKTQKRKEICEFFDYLIHSLSNEEKVRDAIVHDKKIVDSYGEDFSDASHFDRALIDCFESFSFDTDDEIKKDKVTDVETVDNFDEIERPDIDEMDEDDIVADPDEFELVDPVN